VLLRFVRGMARESHLVASLPQPGGELSQDFKSYVLDSWFAQAAPLAGGDIRSAFLQLCYPWLKTSLSDGLPQRALPPDGVLTGILAANALSQGVFNSAAGNRVLYGYDLFPAEFFTPADEQADSRSAFYRHVSVFARSPGGIELISDVTASRDESYRPAVVSRLMSLLVRAARNQGRSTLFEPMSHATWRAVEKSLSALLQAVFEAGGLRGVSAADAFDVQCDESTMSRNDMIANLSFQPAIPVQRIQVALSLQQDGHVELQGAA
jgi:phage tail sheath protein FI